MDAQDDYERPIPIILSKTYDNSNANDNKYRKRHDGSLRTRNYSDTDTSCVPETTSESGISDLDMSEKCNCCPYGFHVDVDFVNFLETLDGKNLIKQLKKIQRKRNERIQRSMEYVIDEVEKIRRQNEYDYVVNEPNIFNDEPTNRNSLRHIDASPQRPQVTEQLKRTISKIDQEITKDFDPHKAKYLIEQHRHAKHKHTSASPQPNNKHRSISQSNENIKRRSRSTRRSKSHSKSPTRHLSQSNNEEVLMQNDEIITTTTYHQRLRTTPTLITQHRVNNYQNLIEQPTFIPDYKTTSQEVTLNIVSLPNSKQNNLNSSDSSSTESLDGVNIRKLKINEEHETIKTQLPQIKKPQQRYETCVKIPINISNDDLHKRIYELELKLNKLPELERKNSILIEERINLIKQLNDRVIPKTTITKRDVGIECKVQTRDVGMLHEQIVEDEKYVEMAQTICSLKAKLDEQTLTLQKPQTRDVAIMHIVDKIENEQQKPIEKRDVAINHRTENEYNSLLEKQKMQITNTFIKEIDVLKQENCELSKNLENLIKLHSKSVVTRGTHPIEQPQLYSIGCNTQPIQTRDVQVMFTPKCRDVALSTDRFYYTRDVCLYCNLDAYEEIGNEQISSLFELKTNINTTRNKRYTQKEYRDVCIGVNTLPKPEEPKITRNVKIGVNLDKLKEQRDVSIGVNLDKKITRDVCVKVNLDEKELRDVCVGVDLLKTETKDASIFVNLIEPVKLPEKPQQKHVCLDTHNLHIYKDANTNTNESTLMRSKRDNSTDTSNLIFKRDAICGANNRMDRYDFSSNVSFDSPEKIALEHEIIKLRSQTNKLKHDASVSTMDYAQRLNASFVHNTSTSMDVPKLQSKSLNTDTIHTRESFTNTDTKRDLNNYVNRACGGDQRIDDQSFVDINEYNTVKKQLKAYEFEKSQKLKNLRTQGVGLCSVYDNFEQIQPKPRTISIGVGSDDTLKSIYNRSIGCGDCKIDGNFCEKCSNKEVRNVSVNTFSTITRNESNTDDYESINRKQEQHQQHQQQTVTLNIDKQIPKINELRKETDFEQRKIIRMDNSGKKIVKETISLTSEDNKGNRTSETNTWQNLDDNNDTKPQTVRQKALAYNEATLTNEMIKLKANNRLSDPTCDSKTKLRGLSPNLNNVTSITIPITSNTTTISTRSYSSQSGNKGTNVQTASTKLKQQDDDDYTHSTTEEILYNQDGEIIEKRSSTERQQPKPKSILKTSTSGATAVVNKALKFGGVIKGLNSASEESMSIDELNDSETSLNTNITYITHSSNVGGIELPINIQISDKDAIKLEEYEEEGDEGELEEIDDFENQEVISSIKDDDIRDPNIVYAKKDIEDKSSQRFELELELHIACAILNESLYEPLKADKHKVAKALHLIQQDWFRIAAQDDSNPQIVMEHLNAFYSRFSNLLLERIVNMADKNLNTVLHYSVSKANFEIVNLLLDTKVCDVNAQNQYGYTSIMLAAMIPVTSDYERMTIKRLFAEGNVNIKSSDGLQTALMLGVRHGNKETVQLLLEAGADVNLQDKDGSTALMAACEHGFIDIVRLLLDNSNCDPDIKDNDGENAFDIAKSKKRNDIIVLLYAHSSKLRSHHPAVQFSKTRPRIGSASSQNESSQSNDGINDNKI